MQFQVEALKEGRFKKPVEFSVPSEELNNAGKTIYHKAHFVAEYINVDDKEREANQKQLREITDKAEALPDDASFEDHQKLTKAVKALKNSFIQKYLVGIEKHKKHPFPFLTGKDDFKDIPVLLDIRLFQEAVSDAYEDEINKNQNEKIKGLLAGNLKR